MHRIFKKEHENKSAYMLPVDGIIGIQILITIGIIVLNNFMTHLKNTIEEAAKFQLHSRLVWLMMLSLNLIIFCVSNILIIHVKTDRAKPDEDDIILYSIQLV